MMHAVIIALLLLAWPFEANAEPFPRNSSTYNQYGTHKMGFNCTSIAPNTISYDFTKVLTRQGPRQQAPAEHEKRARANMDAFENEGSLKLCPMFVAFSNALETGEIPDENIMGISNMEQFKTAVNSMHNGSTPALSQTNRHMNAMADICKQPTIKNARKNIDFEF